jgi:hypothetical protein
MIARSGLEVGVWTDAAGEPSKEPHEIELIQETLEEESAADEKLTFISEEELLPSAVAVEQGVGG